MNVRPRRLVSLGLSVLMLVAVSGTAQAKSKVYEQGPFSDSGTDTACDKYDVSWWNWGHYRIDQATAETNFQFFYYSQEYNFRTVITNPANGKWFTEHGSGTFRERNAVLLHDAVFAHETVDRGTYSVENRKGKTVYRDHGTVVVSYVFDSLGDSKPGGVFLEDPVELKNTWDPDFDFCALADRLIG